MFWRASVTSSIHGVSYLTSWKAHEYSPVLLNSLAPAYRRRYGLATWSKPVILPPWCICNCTTDAVSLFLQSNDLDIHWRLFLLWPEQKGKFILTSCTLTIISWLSPDAVFWLRTRCQHLQNDSSEPLYLMPGQCWPFLPQWMSHHQPKNAYRKRTVLSESEIHCQCCTGSTPIYQQYLPGSH